MGRKACIEASGLHKRFGRISALSGLDIWIPEGIIFGLLGPNGAGKSTFLRCVAGLVRPDSGDLTVAGFRYPAESRMAHPVIGYMPQSPALYSELTVAENLAFFAGMYRKDGAGRRITSGERQEGISRAIDIVALGDRMDSPVSTLSGGMKQRVSLACALVHRPRILILDEPTVGVDPGLRKGFWEHFRKLAAQGTTILVSSHVMDEAARCDTLALIRDGRVLATGSETDIVNQAKTDSLEKAFLILEGGAK